MERREKMKTLAMDSSSQALSVAVLDGDKLLAETNIYLKKNHSITLMPTIDFLMQSVDLKPQDLERIAVAQGPGSYTGLRMAVATAKTLAYSLQIDLVGVSSLYALLPKTATGLVVAVMDARRNHVYAGFYENGRAVESEKHMDFEEVLARVAAEKEVTFVGEVAAFKDQIEAVLPHAQIEATSPSAEAIGRLAQQLPAVPVDAFVPNYLKRVEAEENWLKHHDENPQADYVKRV